MPVREVHVSQLILDIEAEQQERDWSNRAVADALNISPSTLTNWYAGMKPTLTGDNLAGICEFLQIGPGDVIERLGWGARVTNQDSSWFLHGTEPVAA